MQRSMDNPYYVSFEHPWVDKAKNLWNKYGGGTDHEYYILRQLRELLENAKTLSLYRPLWERNLTNISILVLKMQGKSQRDATLQCFQPRAVDPKEAAIYTQFVHELNDQQKESMKNSLIALQQYWRCQVMDFLLDKLA